MRTGRWVDDATLVVAAIAGAPVRVVGVDGRSGAGKTDLAARLAADLPAVRVVHLDDVYPGWEGLQAGLDHVATSLLAPLAAGAAGGYRRWDWLRGAPADWVEVPPLADGELLVVEGCGALAEPCGAFVDLGVWCHADVATRHRRAMARDGASWAHIWTTWAGQEDRLRPRKAPDICYHSAG